MMKQRVPNITSIVVLIVVVLIQVFLCIQLISDFEAKMTRSFSLEWAQISINENPEDPSYQVHLAYLEKAKANKDCPEYDYLVQRFKRKQIDEEIEFKNWKQSLYIAVFFLCAVGVVRCYPLIQEEFQSLILCP